MSLGAVPTIAAARFAIIGYGAITEEIVNIFAARGDFRWLTGVLVRPGRVPPGRERAAGRFPVTDSIDALLAAKPDCVIECACVQSTWRPSRPRVCADDGREQWRRHDLLYDRWH